MGEKQKKNDEIVFVFNCFFSFCFILQIYAREIDTANA